MSHYSKIFNKVPVEVPNRSGFDMSHENLYTAPVGTLVPCMVDELLPNDKVSLGTMLQCQLPPMATDFYGRVDAKIEAFFVPNRILWGGWQDFITHQTTDYGSSSYAPGTTGDLKPTSIPSFYLTHTSFGPGSLADYLGLKFVQSSGSRLLVNNILPFMAYHKIWEDWYRDSRIQRSIFERNSTSSTPASLPYRGIVYGSDMITTFADGVSISSLRQRNYARDYFTNATLQPQAGTPATLSFATQTPSGDTAGSGSFTIASLRAANALQQWMERNNLAGERYGDQIQAQFGIYPADAITDRSLYLGSITVQVYNKSVYQSASVSSDDLQQPFKSVASKYGTSQAVGEGSLVDSFTASEHGFLFVMFSLVPHAQYATGVRRYLNRSKPGDFAFPLLQGVGDQAIMQSELVGWNPADPSTPGADATFGYTQRYSEYKYMDDEVHGLLRDNSSLSSFALKRSFSYPDIPTLGSDFLEIKRTALDDVTAVKADASKYGCWVDQYFKYKKSSTLQAYSIPTLGDLKNTHTEVIDNGGKRL